MLDFSCYVLYDKFPKIDHNALRDYIVSLEPDAEETCEVSEFPMSANDQGSVCRGVVTFNGLSVAVMIYGYALADDTARGLIEVTTWADDAERDAMRDHKVHAHLTCLGSADYEPIEAVIMLLKVSMALCNQDGLGMVSPMNCVCLPCEILDAYAKHARLGPQPLGFDDLDEEEEDGEEQTLWESLRDEGMPGELLSGVLPAEIDGQIWFLTSGHSLYQLPELAYRANDYGEFEEIEEHFRVIFAYLYHNGPVLRPGSTLSFGEEPGFRFESLPAERKELESTEGTLVLVLDESVTEE